MANKCLTCSFFEEGVESVQMDGIDIDVNNQITVKTLLGNEKVCSRCSNPATNEGNLERTEESQNFFNQNSIAGVVSASGKLIVLEDDLCPNYVLKA